ncbi:unnamed protein product, partial [Urochloa humidicola]
PCDESSEGSCCAPRCVRALLLLPGVRACVRDSVAWSSGKSSGALPLGVVLAGSGRTGGGSRCALGCLRVGGVGGSVSISGSGEMEGAIVRRVIPSDNSCLFNAVGYVMEHNRNKASELRQVIAATVASDPVKFNEVFLGKPNEAYCAWILDPEKWGGAIELSILSEYYGREIAAYDIQTTRCDLYGQEKNYSERVMLIYDGLHYDALAMSPAEGAPEEFDQTIFPVNHNRSIGPAEGLALNLVKEAQRKRSYTDTANFTLRCGVCQIGVIGQK